MLYHKKKDTFFFRGTSMALSLGVKAVIFTGTLAGVTFIDMIRVFNEYKKMDTKVNNK
jgi:hypothetical protein|tara:strand:+ start:1086 stop:1259 length:174 start_codon:yes stop_codon:yes gene_type:complete